MMNDTIAILLKISITQTAFVIFVVAFCLSLNFTSFGKNNMGNIILNLKTNLNHFFKILSVIRINYFEIIECAIVIVIALMGMMWLPLTDSIAIGDSLLETSIINFEYSWWPFTGILLFFIFYSFGKENDYAEGDALLGFFVICLSLLIPIVYETASLHSIIFNQLGNLTDLGMVRFPMLAICVLFVGVMLSKKLAFSIHRLSLNHFAGSEEGSSLLLDILLNMLSLFYINLIFIYLFWSGYNNVINFYFLADYIPLLLVVIPVISVAFKLFVLTFLTSFLQKYVPYPSPNMEGRILKFVILTLIITTLIQNIFIKFNTRGVLQWPI